MASNNNKKKQFNMKKSQPELTTNKEIMSYIMNDLSEIKDEIKSLREENKNEFKDLRQTIRTDYVTRNEFAPIRSIVYGAVSLILVSVIGAILALVIKQAI